MLRRFVKDVGAAHQQQKEANRLREQALSMPSGEAREALLRKAQRTEIAAHIDKWISSPGLRPPE